MYNEEQKMRYIETIKNEDIKKFVIKKFNDAEIMEKRLDLDVSLWLGSDIMSFYKYLSVTSQEILGNINSQFSIYTQWCIQNFLVKDHQNHYLEITTDMMLECLNKHKLNSSILSRQEFMVYIKKLRNPMDQFILLALFEGIRGDQFEEIINLNLSDINGNTIKLCTGRTIECSSELIEYALKSANEYVYKTETSERPLTDIGISTSVIKNKCNAYKDSGHNSYKRVYTGIINALKEADFPIAVTISSIYESGRIDMFKKETAKFDISIEEFCNNAANRNIFTKYRIIDTWERYTRPNSVKVWYNKYKEFLDN